jgi:hypothetical protein
LEVIASMPKVTSKTDLCKATGYIRTTEGGKTKIMYSSLMAAIVEAKGVTLPANSSNPGGPRPSFVTSALNDGNIVVGKCYSRMLGVTYGDKFDIEVDEEEKTITLKLASN